MLIKWGKEGNESSFIVVIFKEYFIYFIDYLMKSIYYKSPSLIFKPEISFRICTSNDSNW